MNNALKYPLVSVVIPTYNRVDLLVRAVLSATQQTYQNLEIIIVDDASNDSTESVVKAFEDCRISYLKHDANCGASTARNNGVKAAKGDYVAFLDSDDEWVTNKVELQMSEMLACPRPEKTVCYSQVVVDCGSAGKYVLPDESRYEAESLAAYLFGGGLIHTSSLLLSRKLANSIQFRSDLVIHEDWDLFFRYEEQGVTWMFVKRPLAVWHNDQRVNRLTESSSYQRSLDWLNEVKNSLTEKEISSFLINNVVDKIIKDRGRKIFAEKIIIVAIFNRAISLREGVRLTVRLFVPEKIRKGIISFVKK